MKQIGAIGKIGKINQAANRKLKKLYAEKEITWCEICGGYTFLTWAHRHSRHLYRGQPEKLSEFKQTLLLCVNCHKQIDENEELKERTFLNLRGEE